MNNPNLVFSHRQLIILLLEVFIVSICSLTYELLISTTATHLTSNSVTSFSLSIGLFLAGLGMGAYLSRFLKDSSLAIFFVWIEAMLGMVGGFSVLVLFLVKGFTSYFLPAQIFLTLIIGLFSGLEIPLLTRILHQNPGSQLKNLISEILSFDYLGGLAASLLFPFLLIPYLGLVQISFLIGLINLSMAVLSLWIFWPFITSKILSGAVAGITSLLLLLGLFFSQPLYSFAESNLYRDPIIYSTQTPYQRLVFTQKHGSLRMYSDGGIQFNSQDEYRYHEALVEPSLLWLASQPISSPKIAILGGGDGLAAREILAIQELQPHIQVVDIDPTITNLAQTFQPLVKLNQKSLLQPQVSVINQDAQQWLANQPENKFDLIIADFPDPDTRAIAKLYSQEFYQLANSRLSTQGVFVTQSSGPLISPPTFWSIHATLDASFPRYHLHSYTEYVPSFGLWGFQMVSPQKVSFTDLPFPITEYSRIYTPSNLHTLFQLSPDIATQRARQEAQINTLNNLILTHYSRQHGIAR